MQHEPNSKAIKRIFIIENEADLSMLMKIYFTRKGYEVEIAHRIDDAWIRIKQFQPNIIFLATAACRNVSEDFKRLKAEIPDVEIVMDGRY